MNPKKPPIALINARAGIMSLTKSTIAPRNKSSPQYGKNALNMEPMINIGFSPEKESNIMTANSPMGKVKITLTSPDRGDFRKEFHTNKKGESGFMLPMEIKNANFLLEKEGYHFQLFLRQLYTLFY